MFLLLWATNVLKRKEAGPEPISFTLARTLDRTWGSGAGATPGSGGGNVSPQTFVHNGETWQLWQVVPFLGSGVSPPSVGDCRVQLRNRAKNRGSNLLEDMPTRIILSIGAGDTADWTGLPWTFTRPTANNKFTNVASGNNARKGIDYEPVHTPAANPGAAGIAQGESFRITLFF